MLYRQWIGKFFELADKMSSVSLDFTVTNNNDYSVDGSLQLYTISGSVTNNSQTAQYRTLNNSGTAGNSQDAPATGNIIPLK
jgi:hypothetical protein